MSPPGTAIFSLHEGTNVKERKKVSVACGACRKRKVKCSGDQPCALCRRLRIACMFDVDSDKRTLKYREQNNGELEQDSRSLRLMIAGVKTRDEAYTSQLVDRIMASESTTEIAVWLNENDQSTMDDRYQISSPVESRAPAEYGSTTMLSSPFPQSEPEMIRPSPQRPFKPNPNGIQGKCSLCCHAPAANCICVVLTRNVMQHASESQRWHPVLCTDFDVKDYLASVEYAARVDNNDSYVSALEFPTSQLHSVNIDGAPLDERIPRKLDWASHIKTNGFPWAVQQQQLRVFKEPEWSILPLSFDDGSPFCRACVSFWKAAKTLMSKGTDVEDIIGGPYPHVELFFVPRRHTDSHNVGNWAVSIASSFTEFEAASRLTSVVLYFQFMRWLIKPCPETYHNIPVYQRPTIAQRLIPHSAVFDLVHEAEVRTGLCQKPRDFFSPACGKSVNWSKTIEEAVTSDEYGSLVITDEFKIHALNQGNWTYPKSYLLAFPELQGLVHCTEP